MSNITYQKLLEKAKSRQIPSVESDNFGFSRNEISNLGKKDLEPFISEFVNHLNKWYGKNKEFKAMVDSDIETGTKETSRKLITFLKDILVVISNKATIDAIKLNPSNVADRLVKGLEKTFEKVAPVAEAPVKDLEPLSKEELKLFGFEDGLIEPKTSKESYHEAIKDFITSDAGSKMSEAEKSKYINRFKKTYNTATGIKTEDELLDSKELENFKLGEKKLKNLNEIGPDINQSTAFSIAQSLHKKRLHPDVKKDLLMKLFNTIKHKKITEHGSLNKFEEKWLNRESINKMLDSALWQKTRIEYLEGQPPMTQEERREFRRDDELKRRIKMDDPGRVFEITRGGLMVLSGIVDSLRKTDWEKDLSELTKKLKVVIPPVGEVQSHIESIEEVLRSLNVNSKDLPQLLHNEGGQYKPDIDNTALKGILDKMRAATEALTLAKEEKDQDKIKKATANLKNVEADKNRLLKLRGLSLKGLKLSVNNYLDYLKSKKDEFAKFKDSTVDIRKNINVIEEHIKELRNHFRDLMREEEFMTRWNKPSSVTEEEKEKTELLGKDFPKEKDDKIKKTPVSEKTAMDTDKYQKSYANFMDSLDLEAIVGSTKDSVNEIVKTLALKMLSIVEMGTFKIEELKKLQEKSEHTKGEQKKRILSEIETLKLLPEKLGIKKDFFNNPYGGKGPSLKEMEDKLNELVRDLEKIDLEKKFEKIDDMFTNLEDIQKYVELSKPVDEGIMMRMASSLRAAAGALMKRAVERRVAPSNVGTMYDIAFGRKKPTPSGVTRRLPNFFIQDTSGLAKKVIEYLEKTGIPDMISNPKLDVSAKVEEAVKKTLKIPGKIEDFLANRQKREFETRLDLKKAREDLKRVNILLEGKKDADGKVIEEGLQEQLDTFREKNINQIESALQFVLDPLEQLKEAVESEKVGIPRAEEIESKKSEALTELLGRVSGIPKGKGAEAVLGDVKKFVDDNIDFFLSSKTGTTPKDNLLKHFNDVFGLSDAEAFSKLPDTEKEIDETIKYVEQKDKKKIAELIHTIENFPKENAALVKKFEAEHNLDLDKINRNKDTNAEWQKYMASVMREFNAFIETMGGVRKVDILEEYNEILGKKHSDFPPDDVMKKDIKDFIEGKKKKLKGQKDIYLKRIQRVATPESDKEFLKAYNEKLGKAYKKFPSPEEVKKDFKEYVIKEQGDVVGDKELIEKFNKVTGLQLTRLPSIKEIEEQVKKNTGKAMNFSDIIKSKETALKALESMPEAVEKSIRRERTDITGERWYKNLLRDKSHHKTRWIERLLKDAVEPVDNIEQYGLGVKRVKEEVSSILNNKNVLMGQATKIPIDRIKKQMDEQLKHISDLIENKNADAKVMPLITYRTSIIDPLNKMLEAKDNIASMQTALEAHISEYNKLKDFYDTKIRTSPEKNFEKEQSKVLSGVKAYINFYMDSIKKSKDTIDKVTADIYPHAEGFIKSVSAAVTNGVKNINKDYMIIIDERLSDVKKLITEVETLVEKYKKSLESDREYMAQKQEGINKEAAYDPYGENKSPSELALEHAQSKDDFISKDKPEFYKKIQKTISYLKKVIPAVENKSFSEEKLVDGRSIEDSLEYFKNLSEDIPNYTAALKLEIIPGLRGLLKQKVKIPGLLNITTSLEDAVQTLDDLMDSYASARTKLKNRVDTEVKRQGISLTKIKDISEFMDPVTGEFIDFNEKEKDILKRVFMRQVYKYLDELWAQKQAQMHPTMGDRSTDFYNDVWKSFKELSGIKTNRKFIAILNVLKAETKADSFDDVKRIYLKSQQLEDRKKELEKGLRDLGLDPEKNNDIKELEDSIAKVKEKEGVVDRIFNEMFKGSELQYISKIREGLRAKALVLEKDTDLEEYAPTAPIIKQKKEKEEKAEIDEVVKDVNVLIDKVDEGLKAKGISNIEATMDKLINKSNDSIKNLEEILKQGAWEIKSATYRADKNFNPNILYGSRIQATIKNLLKSELSR